MIEASIFHLTQKKIYKHLFFLPIEIFDKELGREMSDLLFVRSEYA